MGKLKGFMMNFRTKLLVCSILVLSNYLLFGEDTSCQVFGLEHPNSHPSIEAHRKCRDWQVGYLRSMESLEHHSSLIYHSIGGLSDSLTGMVTAFLVSYALERRFRLSSDNILWGAIDSKVVSSAEKYDVSGEELTKYLLHKKTGMTLILRLSKQKMDEVHLIGNRGSIFKILNSKEFKNFDRLELRSVGPDFVFGCLLNLLASPTTKALKYFDREHRKLQRKDSYKVGLQVRTFETLRGIKESSEQAYLKRYQIYADCVKNVVRHRKSATIFIISDSHILRQAFVKHFKSLGHDSFTTNIGMRSILSPWWSPTGKNQTARSSDEEVVSSAEAAFGESFLYSLNDAYVYTRKSGFGRVAAASGMRSGTYFPIGRRSITSARMCNGIGFSMTHIQHDSAGLR